MDDIVIAALRKWPQVPDCRGWLALDARGDWFLRDDRAQATGPFPAVKGSRVEHEGLRNFIARNYEHDTGGAWFFQNGPQRVYVELEATPWVWRIDCVESARAGAAWTITSHTGLSANHEHALLDERGRLFLATDRGLGLVHTLDMQAASDAIEAGVWTPVEVRSADLPRRYGYRLSPAADAFPPLVPPVTSPR